MFSYGKRVCVDLPMYMGGGKGFWASKGGLVRLSK